MLNIIAEGKKYQLSNEQVVIVRRVSVKRYYLLVMSLFIYNKALNSLSELGKLKNIKDIINYTKIHALDIAKTQIEFNNIIENIKYCIDGIKIEGLQNTIILEILSKILEFNTLETMDGKPLNNLDELNEEFEAKLGLASILLKIKISEILELPNYDIAVLLREHNRYRVNIINDIRLAHHGDKTDYIKYTKGLMGFKVFSGEDIRKNPEVLKGMVH